VPYRISCRPDRNAHLPFVDPIAAESLHKRRVVRTLVAAVAGVALAIGAADVATRPVLGPDVVDEPTAALPLIMMKRTDLFVAATHCGGDPGRPWYDVDRALRPDEPMIGEPPDPEGEGPARRRYVLPDPDEHTIIKAHVSLVTDTTGVSVRRLFGRARR
jgi:hypothetical protein